MDTKRPQLNRDELQALKWLLGNGLAVLAAWSVFFMGVPAWTYLTLLTVVGVLTAWRPRWPALVPGWVHKAAFPVIVLVFAADLFLQREPLPGLVRLCLMLLIYRVISYRARRDDLQVILLGLFLIVVTGVITVSLAFAGQILAFTGLALVFMLAVTLADDGLLKREVVAPRAGNAPAWTALPRRTLFRKARAALDWRVAAFGAGLFGALVVLAGVLFLAIPRFEIQSNFFLDQLMQKGTRTGFSEKIQFGDVVDIQEDNSIAFTADVSDPAAASVDAYWRMLVLDRYDGGGFSMSPELKAELGRPLNQVGMIDGHSGVQGNDVTWTIYFEAGVSRYLPVQGPFRWLRFTEPRTVSVSDRLRIVGLTAEPPKMFAYRVYAMRNPTVLRDPRFAAEQANQAGGEKAWRPDFLALNLSASERAQLGAWRREIGSEGAADVSGFASATAAWLARRHQYSLQSSLPGKGGDPLVRWLSAAGPGHCELFAGAMVLLARDAGIPARLITGFHGGDWNPISNNLTVRNANAHAWCELWDEAVGGWRRVDATPGGNVLGENLGLQGAEALAAVADRGWQTRWESLRVFWYRRVVDFDQTSQAELAKQAKRTVEGWAARLRERLDRLAKAVQDLVSQPWDARRLALGLGWIVAMAGGGGALVWVIQRAWIAWRHWRLRRVGIDPVRREAGMWLSRLGADGREEDRILADLRRLRFGAQATWPEPANVFRAARLRIRQRA